MKKIDPVQAIIDEELAAAQARITERTSAIVAKHLGVVKKKHPKLERVLVGNGTWVFQGDPKLDGLSKRRIQPRYLARFITIMDRLAYVECGVLNCLDDLTPT